MGYNGGRKPQDDDPAKWKLFFEVHKEAKERFPVEYKKFNPEVEKKTQVTEKKVTPIVKTTPINNTKAIDKIVNDKSYKVGIVKEYVPPPAPDVDKLLKALRKAGYKGAVVIHRIDYRRIIVTERPEPEDKLFEILKDAGVRVAYGQYLKGVTLCDCYNLPLAAGTYTLNSDKTWSHAPQIFPLEKPEVVEKPAQVKRKKNS